VGNSSRGSFYANGLQSVRVILADVINVLFFLL